MKTGQIKKVIEVTNQYASFVQQQTAVSMTENYTGRLKEFLQEDDKTSTTLWVLQAPILVLLAAFISMVSRQLLMLEETEIAVFKSRGIGKAQIIRLYIGQSLILNVLACILGVPFGAFICQMLGSSNAFLEFVGREALKINVLKLGVALDCLFAVLVSTLVMVLPVIKYADTSIVGHRQKKGRKHSMPFWQRFGLDFLILLISLYGYYNFSGKEEELMKQVLAGESLDPLLYFSSSLFIVGFGLVMIRVIHYIVRLIFWLGRKFWSPALYASFSRVIRTRNQQNFIVVFLILTIALGIFNAQTARTVNANDENNIMYQVGADVVLKEEWKDNQSLVDADTTGTITLKYQEPDFDKYLGIEGVVSAAKVYIGSASIDNNDNIILMGIDTKEFGETAWFADGLLDTHWYNYLNAMAGSPYGILVSESFRTDGGFQLGDTLYYSVDGTQTWGIICGFVDYWPGFVQSRTETFKERTYEIQNNLIIAHRAQLQSVFGLKPYQVFLKTNGDTEHIHEYLVSNDIKLLQYTDASQILIDHKNDSILQGTNGMLTVGFIAVLLICIVGFLIFWILSIKSRTLQFGVFRAMGMTMKEIMTMLINEQLFITGISVVAGVFVGLAASRLFVPLIQIAYANADNILPLMLVSNQGDTYRILIVVSLMIAACIGILGTLVSRTKITQALKLGED
jgi:putative ABC transport system permease protein